MQLADWVARHGGIVHREEARRAGYTVAVQRAEVRARRVFRVRRHWLVILGAPVDLVVAAQEGGRVACVSLARRKGWWVPSDADARRHLARLPGSAGGGDPSHVVHWSRPIAPGAAFGLEESTEDALAHIAQCLTPEQALVVWESAIRRERLDVDALRRVGWTTVAARECAASVTGLSDSGLETVFVSRAQHWGVAVRQQVVIAGKRVDILVGDRLVVQIDGWEHHSTSAQRAKDVAHDAELTLRGFTVLRFTYAQVLHEWPAVERVVARAIAAGLHLAA